MTGAGLSWDGAAVVAAVGLVGGYLRWFVRVVVREENDHQIAKINGTYVRSAGSTLTGAEIERRLEHLEQIPVSLKRAKA